MRSIKAIEFPDAPPGLVLAMAPEVIWADPRTLLVEEAYQRAIGEKGMKIIKGMVTAWDWRRFKMPNVCRIDEGLVVLDGQHTAIGAASNPMVEQIPLLVVAGDALADRAGAFVGVNRDRVNLTPMQLHKAAVVHGDEDALTLEQVCMRAGVKVLAAQTRSWKAGETVAVQAIASLINRRHAKGAREVLEVLVKGGVAPITSQLIKAVEAILFDTDFKGKVTPEKISETLIRRPLLANEAAVFATTHRLPNWKAFTSVLFRAATGRG